MSIRPTVEVLLSLVDNMSAPLRSTAQGVHGIATGIGNAIKGMAAAAIAYVAADFFKSSIEEALQAEKAVNFLRQAVNNAGESFASWQPKVDQAINGLVKSTKYGDDEFRQALTNMIAKSGDVEGSYQNLQLVADVAAKKQIGLAEAGELVGKGMAGNTRVFRDFGIMSGTTAEKMEQLRAATHGYANAELDTLGGRLAQGKTAFMEMKEQIGNMVLGSDAAREGAGRLATALGDLAVWLEKNKAAGIAFVDAVINTGSAIVDLLKPVWDLIKSWYVMLDQTGALGVVFRGLQIALVATSGFFGAMAAKVEGAIGSMVEGLGKLLRFGAPLLDKLGLGVGETADKMIAAGQRMVKAGGKAYDESIAQTKDKILLIATATKTGQKKVTDAHDEAVQQRKQITDEELKGREATTKKSHENLAALEDIAFKGSLTLLTAQQREYQELVRQFQEKMLGMTKEDYTKGQALLAKAHGDMLLKWAGFGKELVPKVQGPVLQIRDGMMDITSAVTKTTDEVVEKARRWEELKAHARDIGTSVAEAANNVLGFADALGVSDAKMEGLVGGIGQLGDAVGKIASGDVLGGLKQGIGAISKVVGSLFGKSEQEKAVEAALNKNRESLNRLTEQIGDLNLNLTGKQLSGVEGALKEFFASGGAANAGWGDRLADSLKARGLSVTDLDQVAKTLGIDIRPGGHLDPDTLRQLITAIGATEPTQFGVDYSGRRDQIRAGVALGTVLDEGAATAELAKQISPAFAKAFEGIDVTTAVGKAAASTAIQGLFAQMSAGALATADLGGLRGSDFLQLLQDLFGFFGAAGVSVAAPSADSGIASPIISAGSPGVAPIVTSDFASAPSSASFGFRELGDFLGGKLDTTNDKLDTLILGQERLTAVVASTGGAGSQTVDEALAASLALTQLSRGT